MLLVPVTEGRLEDALRPLDRGLRAALGRRAKAVEFRGRPDDLLVHHVGRQAVALAGLGTNPQPAAWRKIGAKGRREADRQGARWVALYVGAEAGRAEVLAAAAEGFLLAGYRFDRYRAERNGSRAERLTLIGEGMPRPNETRALLDGVAAVVAQVVAARNLVNEPPSVATPAFLADHARALAKATPGLVVEVWDPKRIAKEKLAGLLAVARGSHEEPRFITLRHEGAGARRRIALIGKGITFDSGGLSLKPAKSMETMKYDMAGGAAVLSAVAAAAAVGLPVDVTAYVPATENLPGGSAQKPGDVIRYANGKTVEVLNTDAEGRLVLADALTLASRSKPDAIIDLATLTGAARVALGTLYAGVLGNDQGLVDALLAASRRAGEPLWQLPLVREYRDELRSPVADLKNVGGGGDGGTIVAALFLEEFVAGVPWAHLDIAGPAFSEKDLPHVSRGATGYGVRLLVEYLRAVSAS
jgi:leucyl aminopeptidase